MISRETNAEAIRGLASVVLGDSSFEAVLGRAAEVIKASIPGAEEVSVTMSDRAPYTVASTGGVAKELDESQYQAGYGPCLDAIRLGETILVSDQTTESRWPAYSRTADTLGVGSSLSVPLPVNEKYVGGMNIYSHTVDAFDEVAVRTAEDLSAYVGIVLNNAGLYFTAEAQAIQMVEAMKSRASIEQAKGIVMGLRNCNDVEAFEVLVFMSQQTHKKLHLVAATLIDQTVMHNPAADPLVN